MVGRSALNAAGTALLFGCVLAIGWLAGRYQIYFLPGIATILLWLAFAQWSARRGLALPLGVIVGAVSGVASAYVTWAVGSNFGQIPPHWDGEFYTAVGRKAGIVTWPLLGALSCGGLRFARRPTALAAAALGVMALAFGAELMFTGSKG